jgi:hypothetical protein
MPSVNYCDNESMARSTARRAVVLTEYPCLMAFDAGRTAASNAASFVR